MIDRFISAVLRFACAIAFAFTTVLVVLIVLLFKYPTVVLGALGNLAISPCLVVIALLLACLFVCGAYLLMSGMKKRNVK